LERLKTALRSCLACERNEGVVNRVHVYYGSHGELSCCVET